MAALKHGRSISEDVHALVTAGYGITRAGQATATQVASGFLSRLATPEPVTKGAALVALNLGSAVSA